MWTAVRFGIGWLLVGAALVLAAALPSTAGAAARTFSNSYAQTLHGDIAAIGNANSSCATTWGGGCNPAALGTGNSTQGYGTLVDVDGVAGTTNSSASTLALPAGAIIRYARLTWGSAGDGADNNGEATVRLDTPATVGVSYTNVAATYATGCGSLPTYSNTRGFACSADVTALVAAGGNGAYTIGGIEQRTTAGGTAPDHWSGWGLYVVFERAAEPLRRLVLADGFQRVQTGAPTTITASGFIAPASGSVTAQLTYMVGEGDAEIAGDNATFGTKLLDAGATPNLMNSTIRGLTYASGRSPSNTNHYGFDIHQDEINGAIPNAATTANFSFTSTQDVYYPFSLGIAIDLGEPNLVLTKTLTDVNGGVVEPGDVIEYQIVAQNTGNDGAAAVVMTDPIPAGTTYVPGTMQVSAGANAGAKTDAGGDDQATFAANGVTMRLGAGANASAGGVLAAGGASTTARFRVRIDTGADEGVPLTNTASASYMGQTSLLAYADPSSVAATPVRRADMTVANTPSPGLTAGVAGSLTVRASNIGGAQTYGQPVTVTTTIPAGTTFSAITSSPGWTCATTLPTITCNRTDALAASTAYPDIVIALTPAQTASSVTFASTVAGGNEVRTNNNTASTPVTILRSADLRLTASVDRATARVGDTLTYGLTVTNTGPSDTTGVTLTDTLPAGLSLLSLTPTTGSCSTAGQTITCAIGALAVGASATVAVTARVLPPAAGTSIVNPASVTGADPDPAPADNTGQAQTVVDQAADLHVTKTATPATQNVNGLVTWTITVRNDGPGPAPGTVLTDDLPAGITVGSITPSQGTCTGTDPFSCALGTIASGAAATVTVAARPGLATAGTTLTNSAAATSTAYDPDPADDAASSPITVNAAADLRVTKTADKATANVDEIITWTVSLTNLGPSAASGVTLTDTAPTGVTIQAVTPAAGVSCSTAGQTISCVAAGSLPAAQTRVVTIAARANRASAGSPLQNSATAASSVFDPDTANNLSTVTTDVNAAADLRVGKTADRATANIGDTITWTLTATNDGTSTATGVQLTDVLPAGVSLLSATPSQGTCTPAGAQVVCVLGTLINGASATAVVRGTVERVAAETPLQNVAQITGAQFDPDTANNSTNVTTTVGAATDLQLTKTASRATAVVGDALSYTLTATNGGPSTATGVQIVDTLPAGFALAATPTITGGTCAVAGQTLTCTVPSLPSGGVRTVAVAGTVTAAAAGTTLSNTASIGGAQFDQDLANNATPPAETNVGGVSELGLTKTVDRAAANVGDTLTYTLRVTNSGPQPATGTVITDTLPAGLTRLGATASQGSCPAGTPIVCTLGTVAVGATATVTITASVGLSLAGTTVTNPASANSTQDDLTPGNDTASAATTIAPAADLSITKTADKATADVGEAITWTLTATNDGPSAATGVTIDDTVPSGVSLLPITGLPAGVTCAVTGATVRCPVAGTLPSGASRVITLRGEVQRAAAETPQENVATIGGSQLDPDTANNLSRVTTTVNRAADLRVTKTANRVTANVGDTISWTVTVTNDGPSVASGVQLIDDLPAGTTLLTRAITQGSCAPGGSQLLCSVGSLAVGGTATATITARVDRAAAESPVDNVARATATELDPDPANNLATATTTVGPSTDLRITKAVDRATARTGDGLTYTLTATNDGPSAATGVVVSDALPAGVLRGAVTTSQGSCTPAGQTLTCAVGALASGASATITVQVSVRLSAANTTLSNTATVAGAQSDPVPGNNASAPALTSIAPSADLQIATSVDRATANVGDLLQYRFVVTNNGPSAASGVEIAAALPEEVDIVSFSATGLTCGGDPVVCDGSIAAGAPPLSITFNARVAPEAAGLTITATGDVAGNEFDPVLANNSSAAATVIGAAADLRIVKSVNRATANIGDTVVYTLTASNDGPNAATGTTFTDALPAGLQAIGTPTASQGTCAIASQLATCTPGTVASGASVTATITARVQASAAASTIANTASVSGSRHDQTPANNTSSPATTTIGAAADLAVTQTVDQAAVNVGDVAVYTVTVRNDGPQAATSVALTDDLPTGAVLLSATPSQGTCGPGDPFACALGTLAPGATATVAVRVRITGAAESTFPNVASTAATQFDPNASNNSATVATSTNASADLRITKTADKATANIGEIITWTVTATNDGPSAATGVVVTDTAPGGVTLQPITDPAGAACTVSGQVVTCARSGSLASGASLVLTLRGSVNAAAAGTPLANSATVAGNEFDPSTANNLSAVTTNVGAAADLRVSKAVDRATANVGDTLTWTVTATNDGPSSAAGVVITDDLPTGVTLLTRAASQGTCAVSGPQVVCTVGALASGASATVTLTGRVERAAAESPVDNTARVTSSVFDPDPADNLSTASTAIGPAADLRVTKAVDRAAADVGDTLTYTLTATNDGPSTATGATITDTLPAGLQIATTPTATQGACTVTGQTVTCSLGSLPDGASATATVRAVVRPSAAASTLANTASITGSRPDPDGSNNATPPTSTAIARAADLVVTNTVDQPTLNLGDTATFTVTVRNAGPSTATSVTLTDDLPAGTTLLSRSTTQGTCTAADPVVCSLGTLASGATATIVVRLRLDSGASANFSTTALAAAAEHDPAPADNTAAAATSTGPAADLRVVKTADKPSANVGETITWTLTAANDGPSAATGATITDVIPAGIAAVTASGSAGVTCTVGTTAVSCVVAAPWAAGAPRTVTLTGVVARTSAGSPLSNQASIAGSEFDPDPADNLSTATTTINAAADLRITKSADRATAGVGDTITWTVAATNDGPSAAAGVAIIDDLPAGVTLLSSTSTQGTCSTVATQVVCAAGPMASGQTVTATLVGRVLVAAAESPVVNAARVTSSTFDPDTANNLRSATTSVGKSVDLTTSAAVSRATANIGDELLFTFTVGNAGPSGATAATFTHVLPANTTFVSAAASQGTCSSGGGAVTCDLGTVSSGGSATVTVRVSIDAAAAGTTIQARGRVAAAEPDRDAGNDASGFVSTSVAPAADLVVGVTASQPTAAVGDTVTYLVSVTNDGPSAATGVTLTDLVPAGATILSVTPSQGSCGGGPARTCALGGLASGASATVSVVARAESANAAALMTNGASVTADQFDPRTANNAAQASTAIGDAADLRITKTADRATAQVGDTVTWTLTASNLGPRPASGVTVSDAVPAGVTITSATWPGGVCTAGPPVSCAIGALAVGSDVVITVVGTVGRAAAGTPLTGQASVTGAELDPDPANNISAATTTVGPAADLRVVKLIDDPSPAIGGAVLWTIQVFNDGPQPAGAVALSDVVPAGAVIDRVVASSGSCTTTGQSVVCALGTIASGDSVTVRIEATIARAAGGSVLDNVATATSAVRDPDTSNNAATVRASAGAAADLSVALTPDRPSAVVGEAITWTAVVGNAGPQAATGVVATITLPAGITDPAATVPGGTCSIAGDTVTCTLADLEPGTSAAITITGIAGRATAERDLIAGAVVAGSRPDPAPADNTASAAIVRIPAAVDLVVTKTSDRDRAAVGDRVTILTSVLNRGPSDATDVILTDTLPEGVQFTSVQPSQGACAVDGRTITCNLGTIRDGETASVTLVVVVLAEGADQSLLTAGSATSNQFDTDGRNNAAAVATGGVRNPQPAAAGPTLLLTKTVDKTSVVAGGQVVWTITVRNTGATAATGVRITDGLPPGLDYVATKPSGATCTRNARTITCTVSSLAPGASASVRVTTAVVTVGAPVENRATVTAAQMPDPKATGQFASAAVRGTGGPFVVAGIKPLETYTRPGRRVRIAVKVTNVGQATASDVVACFTLPRGVVLLRKPAGLTQRGARFCVNAARLGPGANKRIVLAARVVGGAGRTSPRLTGTSANSRVKTEVYPLVVRGARPTRAAGVTG